MKQLYEKRKSNSKLLIIETALLKIKYIFLLNNNNTNNNTNNNKCIINK